MLLNTVANHLDVHYGQSIRRMTKSAERLASGQKTPRSEDGAGELGVANMFRARVAGIDKATAGLANGLGLVRLQDQLLEDTANIFIRMSELAASAMDPLKSDNDRNALHTEFLALQQEFATIEAYQYNATGIFSGDLTLRAGVETAETIILSQINHQDMYNNLSTEGLSLTEASLATTAFTSLQNNIALVANGRAIAGAMAARVQRTMDEVKVEMNSMKDFESTIRDVNLATETSVFTKEQVAMSAGQSVIAQSKGLIQSVLQFLQ